MILFLCHFVCLFYLEEDSLYFYWRNIFANAITFHLEKLLCGPGKKIYV